MSEFASQMSYVWLICYVWLIFPLHPHTWMLTYWQGLSPLKHIPFPPVNVVMCAHACPKCAKRLERKVCVHNRKEKNEKEKIEPKLPVVTFCHPVGGWVGISLPICFKTTVDTLSLSFPNDLS